MTQIMMRNLVHVGDLDLAIDIAYFVLGQYYGCSMNRLRPIGDIIGYLQRVVRQVVEDWLW